MVVCRRGLAAAASGSFQYQTGDVGGIKLASRDLPGPTTQLVVVSKAGSRYQYAPGFSEGLEKFAFKNTEKRSALRITREAELLGGELVAYHSRENLVIGAKFLRDDLPYFAELLGEVISLTKYTSYEFAEDVAARIELSSKAFLGNAKEIALNSAHGVAFHQGLGSSLYPPSSKVLQKYLNNSTIHQFAGAAYAKPNFAVVANGAKSEELNKWVGEFFQDSPSEAADGVPVLKSTSTKYYGGEERISHDGGNAMVIAFPGSSSFTSGSSYKPEVSVLAALLGGETTIKWAPGFSLLAKASASHPSVSVTTSHLPYSDAGLLCIALTGSAFDIKSASTAIVKAIKDVADGKTTKDDIAKALALAKFKALEAGQNIDAGLELTGAGLIHGGKAFQMDEVAKSISSVTGDQVKKIAKAALEGKAAVSTVGDLYVLPYAEEIGLLV
ncbi:MAG: ubiquinol-cytochrome c reductase core subunit 1 [Vezdaea aestivalis]|nr:MAG: ubiquinol-cytochrome c reductase core subunit 1 [Vezdaea aestivalis]